MSKSELMQQIRNIEAALSQLRADIARDEGIKKVQDALHAAAIALRIAHDQAVEL